MKQLAPRWIDVGIFGLFFVLFLHAIEDPDIWFHLTIGRAVLEQGGLPAQEFYVFTRLGQPAEFHEWGFGLFYQLVQQAGGLGGMIIINALLGAATIFLLYRVARNRGISLLAALTAATVGLWLMEFRFVQRPENLLYLALASTLYCTERYRATADWRQLLPIPLIGLLLAQMHPSVFMLGLVLGTYLTEALVRHRPNWRQATPLALTLIATLALSLLNPYGLAQLILPLKFATETELLDSINEFLPALSTVYADHFVAGIVLGLLALTGIKRRFSLAEWLMLVAFALLAFQHVRNIALLGLALVGPLATALERLFERLRGSAEQWPRWPAALTTGVVLLVAVDVLASHRLSWDIEPTSAPVAGAEIVAQQTPPGNILNFYHLGNYLAWRLAGTHQVIIDGRNFRNNPALTLHDNLLLASRGWQRQLDRYAIVAVITPATLPYSGDFIPLAFELAKTPGWTLAGREPAGLVFIRGEKRARRNCAAEQAVWQQAEEELSDNLTSYPDSESSRRALSKTVMAREKLAHGACAQPAS